MKYGNIWKKYSDIHILALILLKIINTLKTLWTTLNTDKLEFREIFVTNFHSFTFKYLIQRRKFSHYPFFLERNYYFCCFWRWWSVIHGRGVFLKDHCFCDPRSNFKLTTRIFYCTIKNKGDSLCNPSMHEKIKKWSIV